MADAVISALNALFMHETGEYAGSFQREMLVRFAADPKGVAPYVAGTPKYSAFIASKAQAAAAAALSSEALLSMSSKVSAAAAESASRGDIMDHGSLWKTIRNTPEYRAYATERVAKVAAMCARTLTDQQTDSLLHIDGLDDLREAIEGMGSDDEESESEDESDVDEAPATGLQSACVDEAFMRAFEKEYCRDATVYEYVHVRNLMAERFLTLPAIKKLHDVAYVELEVVHRELLDDRLDEPAFCKRYVPEALTDPDLPRKVRDSVLSSEGYRRNMRDRLCALHKTLFGEDVTPEEADYMFDRSVLAEKLSLQSDKLNDIVGAFAEQTTRLFETIETCYKAVLGREPEDAEVREVIQSFRVDESAATTALKATMVKSLEYREVLRQEILRARPGTSVPGVFRTLERVLVLPGLANLTAQQAVSAVPP